MLSGRMLHTVPKRMIVQTWRAFHWKPEELDSILILTFSRDPAGGRIDLMHVNVADHDLISPPLDPSSISSSLPLRPRGRDRQRPRPRGRNGRVDSHSISFSLPLRPPGAG